MDSWRSDVVFLCALSLAPGVAYWERLPVHQLVEEPAIHAPYPAPVPKLVEPNVSSTGVSSILASHGVPALDIWK